MSKVKENSLILVEQIEPRILWIRGRRVILDTDLAALYGTSTKVLNQAVKRNIGRFPGDFRFQLSVIEKTRWSQIVTTSPSYDSHVIYLMHLPNMVH